MQAPASDRTSPNSPRLARAFWPLLLALVVLAWSAAAASRTLQGLTVDEPFTANALGRPAGWMETWRHDNTPATYVVLAAWKTLAGESEFALRSAMVTAYALAVLLTGLAGRRIGGDLCGITAALLVATSGRVGLEHAATIRPYALLALESSAAAFLLAGATSQTTRRASWRTPAALGLVHLAGLFTHPIYVFVIAAVSLAGLARDRGRFVPLAAGVAALLVYAALWGRMLASTMALPSTSWMAPPGAVTLWDTYLVTWGNRSGFILCGALLALVTVRPRLATDLLRDRAFRMVAIAGLAAFLVPYLVSFVRPVFHPTRTTVLALPWLAMALGLCLTRLGTPMLTAVLSFSFLVGVAQHVATSRSFGDVSPTRESVAAVLGQAKCGDTLVLAGLSYASVEYYLRRLDAPACLSFESFPREVSSHPGWLDEGTLERDRAVFEREAAATAGRLQSGSGRAIVFAKTRGIGKGASDLVTAAFDEVMRREATLQRKGGFFEEVRVYARR